MLTAHGWRVGKSTDSKLVCMLSSAWVTYSGAAAHRLGRQIVVVVTALLCVV